MVLLNEEFVLTLTTVVPAAMSPKRWPFLLNIKAITAMLAKDA